jgi:hypothetical protein
MLYLAIATGVIYCDEEISSLTILVYKDGNAVSKKVEPEIGIKEVKFEVFYEVTEDAVRRHYFFGKEYRITDYAVLSREKDRDKERINAVNLDGGKIEIVFFPSNHAIIIYYDKEMLSIEEAFYIRKPMPE